MKNKVIEIEKRSLVLGEIRAVDATATSPATISGYAAKFGVMSDPICGMFRETIDPGAFTKNLPGADVRFLVNHDPGRMLARTKSGTLTLSVDSVGLRFDATLPDTTLAKDTLIQIRRGDLDAMSFGFRKIADFWGEDPTGFPVRTLKEVSIFDVSLATYPAYSDTEVSVREYDAWKASRQSNDQRPRYLRLIELGA